MAAFVVLVDRGTRIAWRRYHHSCLSSEVAMIRPFLFVTSAAALVLNSVGHKPSSRATIAVSGTGIDHLVGAVVHSKLNTSTGTIQKSTEIVDLEGDLRGRVLYHVTTVIDSVHATLVNTGDQVFSGTIAGSAPVMIHDNHFRFDVNLKTGAESGHVYFTDHIAGPKAKCTLEVVGTGMNADGNPMFTYKGECTFTR
jgi:hypothetical protein